jgi:hypothetical protein
MSNSPDTGLDLEDLELQLLPAWARQSPDANRYAKYEGGEGGSGPRGGDRRESRGARTERRPRGAGGPDRPRGPREDRPGPPRREGRGFDRPRHDERQEPLQPLPEVNVNFVPEEKGVESLGRQIKLTGRAYPVFDIAHLILKRPDRYHVTFAVVKKPDGQIAQQLWVCNLDDTLWLSDQEALNHVLRKHFDTFYQAERLPTDPPKGTYTFVAQCSLSGVTLGPPNYHDYQNKLRKLHAERFSRMPFEVYKAKVKIVKDEAVVKKWIEEQSSKTEYNCLNVPEPKRLGSRDEVERHFREVHFSNIIRAVDSHTLLGAAAQQLPTPALRQLVRRAWDDQQRFPLRVVTTLSQQLASHGLQFFKVNKTITHVAVARPHFLDMEATPVSDGVKRIVDYINSRSGCTRRQLIEALAPSPVAMVAPVKPAPAADVAGQGPTAEPGPAVRPPSSAAKPASPGDLQEPTPEQTALIADLHWLIHQGHVLEFANGRIETARKPIPKPPRPEAKPPRAEMKPAETSKPSVSAEAPADSPAAAEVESGTPSPAVSETAPASPPGPPPMANEPVTFPPSETPPPPAVEPADETSPTAS